MGKRNWRILVMRQQPAPHRPEEARPHLLTYKAGLLLHTISVPTQELERMPMQSMASALIAVRMTPASLACGQPVPTATAILCQRNTLRRLTPSAAATSVGLSPDCTAATPRLRSSVKVVWSRARASVFMRAHTSKPRF